MIVKYTEERQQRESREMGFVRFTCAGKTSKLVPADFGQQTKLQPLFGANFSVSCKPKCSVHPNTP
jgi:hypothetical protein